MRFFDKIFRDYGEDGSKQAGLLVETKFYLFTFLLSTMTSNDAKRRTSKWRKFSKDSNSGASVLRTLASDAEPELCVQLLKTPSIKNFSGIRPRLEKPASNEWLCEFLNLGGMDCLLDGLTSLSTDSGVTRFTDALEQIECIRCIKAVMNSSVGLELMTQSKELTRSLVKGEI